MSANSGFNALAVPPLAGDKLSERQWMGIFSPPSVTEPPAPVVRSASQRRRKLWELSEKYHCPVVGVCFDVAELRQIIGKQLQYPTTTTDYVWHTIAVGVCSERCPLSEKMNRILDRRNALIIKKFSAFKTASELRLAWREASRDNIEVPGVLWAVCTHPACDAVLEQDVHADIHMLQHQVGAGARADHHAIQALKQKCAELRQENESLREKSGRQRTEEARVILELRLQVTDLKADVVARGAVNERLNNEMAVLRREIPFLEERQRLAQRLLDAEARLDALRLREKELELEVVRLRQFAKYAEETIEVLTQESEGVGTEDWPAPPADGLMRIDGEAETLSGKCVLCVGGRSGAINSYREVVEGNGGRFMHHDGGREENLHRIDGALAAADIVICQVGCISHNAYWRVKEQCKRTGKPCMFVKNTGLSSFGRVVSQAGKMEIRAEPSAPPESP
ncbi:DUF2325 domain-containing protein [Propionivibrio limicola]|uniref:DUF2325 domain-containing protein n=1 Tax=Propionivibrio limicola TaxID=167645 RepID=UPI0012911C15